MNLSLFFSYCLLAIAQAAIAVNVVTGKFLIDKMPIHVYLCGRFFASTVFLWVLMKIARETILLKAHHGSRLDKEDWFYLVMQAMTGGFLFNVLFYWGIQYTTAISAGIISSALPAIVAICAFFILKEKLMKWQYVGIALASLAILIISLDNMTGMSGSHFAGSLLGDFVILVSMIPEALYSIFNKFTNQKVSPMGAALIVNFLIFLMLLPLGLLELVFLDVSRAALSDWVLLFATGFASLFFFWFWAKGLLVVPASTAAIFTSVLPVSTSVFAWAFLDERFSRFDGIGMFFVLLSIAIGTGWLPKLLNMKARRRVTY